MSTTTSNIATDAAAAVSGLTTVATSVETDLSTHKSIINTAADAAEAAAASLQSPVVQAALGPVATTVDTAVTEGTQAVTTGLSLFEEIMALVGKLRAIKF